MARARRNPDELDEGPSDDDVEAFSDVTVKCPKCGSVLHDDVELCWKCGHALGTSEDSTTPKWVIWVAGTLVLLFVFALLSRVF